jgi:hypothetical protein
VAKAFYKPICNVNGMIDVKYLPSPDSLPQNQVEEISSALASHAATRLKDNEDTNLAESASSSEILTDLVDAPITDRSRDKSRSFRKEEVTRDILDFEEAVNAPFHGFTRPSFDENTTDIGLTTTPNDFGGTHFHK